MNIQLDNIKTLVLGAVGTIVIIILFVRIATATRDWVSTLFTAYSGATATDMNYLTDPATTIGTLGGAVSLQSVQSWSISETQPDGTRSGAAAIAWTLKPTADLTIVQNYTVTATSHDKRWFAAAITTSAPTSTTAG